MDDHYTGSAEPRRLLIFVGPAAVIGHRLAAEIAFAALEVGIVDQHDHDLAVQVDALEIVPVALGRGDAVAGEDQRSVGDADLALPVLRSTDRDLIALRQAHRPGRRLDRDRGIADEVGLEQRHILSPFAPAAGDRVAARLKSRGAELLGQIIDGPGLALGRRAAPFERVRPERLHVLIEARGIEHRGRRGGQLNGGQRKGARGKPAGQFHFNFLPKTVVTSRRALGRPDGKKVQSCQRVAGAGVLLAEAAVAAVLKR